MRINIKKINKGKQVEHENHLIEKVMTFGARKPLISILLALLITFMTGYGVLMLTLDTSYDSVINSKNPNIPIYNEVVKEFGSDNLIIIYYQGDDLFTIDKIKLVDDVTYALQDLEVVEKVDSLITTLSIRHTEDGLEMAQLVDTLPETKEATQLIKKNALYSPLIVGNQLSKDSKTAAIVVTLQPSFKDPKFDGQAYELIEKTIQPLYKKFSHVCQIGYPRISVEFEEGILSDVSKITLLGALVLFVSLILMLRTAMAAVIPIVTSLLSIIWTFGLLGYCGIPINLLTAVVPALLIVIGSTEDTHMLAVYLQAISKDEKRQRFSAIRFMAIHVGLPIFLTSFTTTVGFLANSFSDVTLIRHFGISSAIGMLMNLFVTILVLPALLQLFGPRKVSTKSDNNNRWMSTFIQFIERASEVYQKKIILMTFAMVVIFGFFALQVTVSNDPISFFKADNDIVKNSDDLHKNLAGMQVFFVTIHAEKGKDFRHPSELKKLEAVQNFINTQGVYDKVISINDYLKLVNREIHDAEADFYKIPDTQNLVEQYLMLFQRHNIKGVLSSDYRSVNMIVRHNLSDSAILNGYLDGLSVNMQRLLKGANKFSLTGKNLMVNKAAETLFITQVWSGAFLIIIIFILMSILYSSLTAGLVSLVPNLIPVVIMFGTMGILGIPLNPGTAIVAVIAIGIAVDDTIHILSTYNKECRVDGDQIAAARRAIRIEAMPVVTTSLSLAMGFLILTFSRFNIISQFGQLSALTMVIAIFSDLLITPILFKRIRLVSLWDVIALNVGKQVLAKSEIFADMTPFQVKRVILLSQMRKYKLGETIIQQGEIDDKLFIVITGEADIILQKNNGNKQIIAHLNSGDIFGEAGYAGSVKRTATIKATTETLQLLMINQQQIQSSMRFYPRLHAKLNHNICKILAQRLDERTRQYL